MPESIERPPSRVRVLPVQHPEVRRFLEETPNPKWDEMLLFLADTFPQNPEKPELLIEGGVAVHLLNPERQTPDDVDFIFRKEEDVKEYNRLHGKSAKEWLSSRRLSETEENADYLFSHFVPADFHGRKIYLLDKPALAYSKSVPYYNLPSRAKDPADVKHLGVTESQIESFRKGFPS